MITLNQLLDLDIQFSEAVSKGGATAWGSFFSQEGIMIQKTGTNIIGEPAIYAAMKGFLDIKGNTLTWLPEGGGLSAAGDLGYTYGQYIRQFRDDKGEKIKQTGRYLTIWRLQSNNTYKIEVDMGN